jgi:hypothetical protein
MGEVTIERGAGEETAYVVRFPLRWKGDKMLTPQEASPQEDHV